MSGTELSKGIFSLRSKATIFYAGVKQKISNSVTAEQIKRSVKQHKNKRSALQKLTVQFHLLFR